jgi:hypothetical protein
MDIVNVMKDLLEKFAKKKNVYMTVSHKENVSMENAFVNSHSQELYVMRNYVLLNAKMAVYVRMVFVIVLPIIQCLIVHKNYVHIIVIIMEIVSMENVYVLKDILAHIAIKNHAHKIAMVKALVLMEHVNAIRDTQEQNVKLLIVLMHAQEMDIVITKQLHVFAIIIIRGQVVQM